MQCPAKAESRSGRQRLPASSQPLRISFILRTIALLLLIAPLCRADAEFFHPEVELRLRRRADVPVLSTGNAATEEDGEEDYRFRLRVGGEAGWESGIISSLKLEARGMWGDPEDDDQTEPGVPEAYLAFPQIGFTPFSATIGRQPLDFGRGLLFSKRENEWSFDAVRLDYDAFPFLWELVGARTTHLSPDTPLEWIGFARLRHQPARAPVRESEIYGGAVESRSGHAFYPAGGRLELMLAPYLDIWGEVALESGSAPDGGDLSAWIADAGLECRLSAFDPQPELLLRGTFASGESAQSGRDFVPLMDRGIGGVVLRPVLSNIYVYQAGGNMPLTEKVALSIDLYRYRRNEAEAGVVGRRGWTYEGLTIPVGDNSRDIGWEANVSCQVAVREHMSVRLIAGMFNFGSAFENVQDDEVFEGWIEMVYRY